MKLETFTKLTASLYDAALEPARWSSLAGDTAKAFGVESCLMQVQDRTVRTASLLGFTPNLPAKAMETYRDHFYAEDWWATTVLEAGIGNAVICGDHVADDDLIRTEFYADWLAPHGIFDALAGCIRLPSGGVGIVGVHRARRMAPFTKSDLRIMRMFMSHYSAALDLTQRLALLRRGQSFAFEAMDALAAGMVIVDSLGKIAIANRTAEKLFSVGDGLIVRGGRLSARDHSADRALRQAVRDAVLAVQGRASSPPGLVMVPRPGSGSLSLLVCPLPPEAVGAGAHEPMAMILIGTSAGQPVRLPDALARLYGLTDAEARLAGALLGGERLQDYAERIGVSINTARTQLKSILAKAGCNRQSDFIRQVLSDPVLRMISNDRAK